MDRAEALRRLAVLHGIERVYRDNAGEEHETAADTCQKLLAAMGVPLAEDLDGQVAADEDRPWRRLLPPVAVVRCQSGPAPVDLTLPAGRMGDAWRWILCREDGSREEGVFHPADLESRGRRSVDGTDRVRLRLPLPLGEALGYHRLEVAPADPGAGEGETMPLIAVPAAAYLPGAPEGEPRLWGLAVQLYGLRSHRNWGIGDFGDLGRLADICAEAGAGFVGLNPLHALFAADPDHCSPYSPNSRLFLNLLYIDVEAVADVQEGEAAGALLADPGFQARLHRLRSADQVDYREAAAAKLEMLRLAFAHFRQCHLGRDTERAKAWRRFREEGGEALARFALFEALHGHWRREDPSVGGWPAWPPAYRSPDAAEVGAFAAAHGEDIEFAIYLQWLADGQLAGAAAQARGRGLGLGLYRDLALGADGGGAEAWAWQGVYAQGAHIGAPPDAFNRRGQDWGLPPPIPERLREAAYRPFIAMLRANMRHAGALRVDHVMGLSRLFWVPAGSPPTEGAYVRYPLEELMGIVALESVRNRCLVIGEDLGTVPGDLREKLAAGAILSCRTLYFEREADGGLKPASAYPRLALATVTTHDLPTLAGFWQGWDIEEQGRLGLFPSATQQEEAVLARSQDRARLLIALQRESLLPEGVGADPVAVPAITGELAAAVHAWLARTPAMLVGVQAEDILGVVEQPNLPGAGETYPNWRRRLPVALEDWPGDEGLARVAAVLRRERGSGTAAAGEGNGQPRRLVIPHATYRLQFNRDFTLAQATELVPYLAELGVSHCYASSYLKARPGSSHGYDIVDHNAFNPEIGSVEDFQAFADALAGQGMGQILDIVPNHMGVMGADNAWWLDVLENGEASAFAGFFDIDWQPPNPQLCCKVLLPLLGDHYGTVLDRGELVLRFDAGQGEFSLFYYQHRLPIDPTDYPRIVGHGFEALVAVMADDPRLAELQSLLTAFGHLPGRSDASPEAVAERSRDKEVHKRHLSALCADSPAILRHIQTAVAAFNGCTDDPGSCDLLHGLIQTQAWRLAYWRVAADEINYRRFFDINDLAALRMENPAVFEATHRLTLALVAEGRLQGLRVDHADGLFDPAAYFRRLQGAANGGHLAEGAGEGEPLPLYLIIEKILAEHERLPNDWPVHGDTGYRFASLVNGLFVDPDGEGRMTRIYAQFTGIHPDFDDVLHDAKRLVIRRSLHGELNVLANQLWHIAAASRHTCDFTLHGLRDALAEVAACFPVYRTYFADGRLSAEDRRHIEWAVGLARRRSLAADVSVYDFVGAVLSGDIAESKEAGYRDAVWRFAGKFQQFTAPVAAKGMEDTAFYRYSRLVSLNDVGCDPRRFGLGVAAFHAANRQRAAQWPHSLLAGSTHDSKRSEDVRARIDVLSEAPAAWKLALRCWSRINRSKKRRVDDRQAPSANDEYLLYQTLFGTWPLTDPDEAELADYSGRISRYLLKAARESKEHTSWINMNQEYEAALTAFVEALLAPGEKNLFLADFVPTVRRLAPFGLVNSLAQTLLRFTCPGVPDIYQGCELWHFRLVDPDNRQPVDYAPRRRQLAEVKALCSGPPETWRDGLRPLVEDMADGRIKLYLTWCALQLRRRWPEVFRDGEYLPLAVAGARADHVCAFARQAGDRIAIAVVPRLLARMQGERGEGDGTINGWEDTGVELPGEWAGLPWFNVLTGEALGPVLALKVGDLLAGFPVALLVCGSGEEFAS
ncbi:MAG: bifunctional 4-alpha-glucanotransferase/malto-oligosyltrehalose synthase [Rhodocyclaceae bacterium]|nr:bifunctional 4-alpha-glucanotransferase/malto-oligosyltrehalose synthase [Rhodocyclaceae bacterium]